MSLTYSRPRPAARPTETANHAGTPSQRGPKAMLLLLLSSTLLLGGIGTRLAYLQVLESGYNRQLADNNRIRLIPQPPERGRLVDRQGQLLAGSQLSHGVFIWPLAQPQADWQPVIERLAAYVELPPEEIGDRLARAGYNSPFPVRILRNATPAIVTLLEEQAAQLPGVIVQPETVRYYPNGDLGAHVLGYTGEIPQEDLQSNPEAGYRLGDVVGRLGVERTFEDRLRGQWGGQQVEVDANGEVLRVLGEQPSLMGQTVQVTLDRRLQQVAEDSLGERLGAVVAMDVRDGSILAMASFPRFDPNIFSSQISEAQWQEIQSQSFPFLNRTLRGYPPASTYKIVTTAAALESGSFQAGDVLRTAPYITVGGRRFWDWNRAGFGTLGFERAMAYSSDTFFYQTALRMGSQPLQEWSRRFGFGRATGVPLTGEAVGLVPDAAWKWERLGEGWYGGDTINMSIGQGFMTSTPLQVAVMTAAVANGGWLVTPQLDPQAAQNAEREWVGMSPTTLGVLQRGLREVITHGTGRGVALSPGLPAIAGKSGTAEDPPRKSHAWFAAYGPYEQPEIVVVAFLENDGGGGSGKAGPIVREVLEAYFQPETESDATAVTTAVP